MSQDHKILSATLKKELEGIKLTLQALSTREGGQAILALILDALKPKKGVDYFDGKTPEKGVDYFTEAELKQLIADISKIVEVKRGKDYWTKEDVEFVIARATAGVKVPKVGKDFYTKEERNTMIEKIVGLVTKDLKKQLKELGGKSGTITIERSAKALGYIIGQGVATITVAPTAPTSPKEGDLWVKTT